MDIEKLKETLVANGIDEEKIAKILADLEKPKEEEPKGDETQVEGNTEEELPPTNPNEEGKNEEPNPEGENGNGNVEEGASSTEEELPPVPTEEVVPPTDEPTPEEVVQEEVVPPAPQIDIDAILAKVEEQSGIITEQAKTIEGLGARIQSLEDALQTAGVLDKSNAENVGIDEPRLPGSGSTPADNAMSSVLAKLNGNKHF